LENSVWSKWTDPATSATTVTVRPDAVTGPLGDTVGDALDYVAGQTEGRIINFVTMPVRVGDTLTASVWLRADTAMPVQLYLARSGSTTAEGTPLLASLTTEWQRFSVAHTFANEHTGFYVWIKNTETAAKTVYAYGAQVNHGSTPLAYYKTTDKQTLHNALSAFASGENLLRDSEDFAASSWAKGATTMTVSAETTPDGKPATTFTGGGSSSYENFNQVQLLRLPVGTVLTQRVWVKKGTHNEFYLRFYGRTANLTNIGATRANFAFDADGVPTFTGAPETALGIPEASITSSGGGWYELAMSFALTSEVGQLTFGPHLIWGTPTTNSIHLWWAQLLVNNPAAPYKVSRHDGQLGSGAGTDTNDPLWTGQGLQFDGVDDYAFAANSPNFNLAATSATFEVAFRAPAQTTDFAKLLDRFTGGSPGAGFYVGFRLDGRLIFEWRTEGGGPGFTTALSYTDDAWHLVQISVDSATKTRRPLIDGEVLSTVVYVGSLLDNTSRNLFMGSTGFKGTIAHARLRRGTLTVPQLARSRNQIKQALLQRGVVLP